MEVFLLEESKEINRLECKLVGAPYGATLDAKMGLLPPDPAHFGLFWGLRCVCIPCPSLPKIVRLIMIKLTEHEVSIREVCPHTCYLFAKHPRLFAIELSECVFFPLLDQANSYSSACLFCRAPPNLHNQVQYAWYAW